MLTTLLANQIMNFMLFLRKYSITICVILDSLICLMLPRGHVFEAPKLYVHLVTLLAITLLAYVNRAYVKIHWKAALILLILLTIYFLFARV
jgi:hypothetical protein